MTGMRVAWVILSIISPKWSRKKKSNKELSKREVQKLDSINKMMKN